MIDHSKCTNKLSIVKVVFRYLCDCAFMFFLLPSIMWGGIAFSAQYVGWCDGYWEYSMQLAMGAIFVFVYLLLDLLVYSLFDFIQFCIDKSGGVSQGNCCTVFYNRVSIIMYVMFVDVPLLVLFALGMQWTQEYLFIACFFATGIFRVGTLFLSPIITPLFTTYEDLPDEHKNLRGKI